LVLALKVQSLVLALALRLESLLAFLPGIHYSRTCDSRTGHTRHVSALIVTYHT